MAAAPAGAFYQRYVHQATFAPGSLVLSSSNGLTFNAVLFPVIGSSWYAGTKYRRPDNTDYSWIWSNTGSIYDSRTISYGRAVCGSKSTNPTGMYIDFCDTGNS